MPRLHSPPQRPHYADELAAYHRAHRRELRQVIDDLPLNSGHSVLDVACGDGSYAAWLSEKVQPDGVCFGFDFAIEYLKQATTSGSGHHRCVLAAARLEELPFADASFDLVWCAQSLVSLREPVSALQHMRRVVKPGGLVVVLENDALHQLILPWPEEIELAVRAAELRCYRARARRPEKRYAGRRLTHYFNEAGLTPVFRRTYATDRMAPLSKTEAECLQQYLSSLAERISPFLEAEDKLAFEQLVDRDSSRTLINQPDLEITWFDFVCWGRKDTD